MARFTSSQTLSHTQDHAETCLPAHHPSVGLRRLLKRHHLDERPHVGQYAEIQCVLHLDSASRQATEHAPRPENQRHCANRHGVGSDANHDHLSSHLETGQERCNCLAAGSRSQDGIGATELFQSFGCVLSLRVDINMCSELICEMLLVGARADCDDAKSHPVGELHSKMPQAADTLNCDRVPCPQASIAERIERGDSSTYERSCVR